jgi:8-oxo-dGTP pyrophosphatase MutT (NUDIX family)
VLDERDFPVLFATSRLPGAPVDATFALLDRPDVDERLVASAYVVAFVGRDCLMAQMDGGDWLLLGGTKEPGEDPLATVQRELREEAGARLLSYTPFAKLDCHSRTAPLREHLPHPAYQCLLGYGDVEIIDTPTNADTGERTVSVQLMPLDDAVDRFAAQGQLWEGELHRLAALYRDRRRGS